MPGVPPTRFAYLGPEGTFAEMALRTLPAAARATLLAQPSVSAAIDAVRDGEADAAVVPLENSVEGSVPSTVDELASGEPLLITREILLPVSFALLVRPGTTGEAIETVATHPHAEAQCRRWLREHLPRAEIVLTNSTAQAAAGVAHRAYDAAVAAPLASERYRLTPLSTGIADVPDAVTRFVLLSRPGPPPEPTGRDKTSLVAFIADDHTGALLEVLTEFAVRGINLTRIESRPTKDRMGRYCFTLDCEGHLLDARVSQALMALRRICADVRYLGSYARADAVPVKSVPPTATDAAFTDAAAWLSRLREGRGQ
ncbi:MAG: prephenate dehydratase [Geodermatophilaceae bacterium]|nr:prephenate dehydratase [Geodermatophilaceae bacterium]MDQ3466277.1 prephenate dehydratase [Actinomycetota bacterium]